jgi:hypothetical protein
MAAEKKKTDKKKTDKKVEKKAANKVAASGKAVVKKSSENLSTVDLIISVPRGGQVIKHFNLTPALPTASGRGDWLFTELDSDQDISDVTVGFQLNPSPLERALERAILVVTMVQNESAQGIWRFALGGVATDHGDEDPNNDVVVEIIDNGFTLLAYVQVLENSAEYIPFGFVASFTENDSGVVSIYESQDPGIVPVRPIGG